MLRIHCLQHFFNLSDPGAEEALYDSESMRRFVGLDLGEDAIPDERTILRFRHLLERHGLAGKLLDIVGSHLEAKGLVVKSGKIVHYCRTALDQEPGQNAGPGDAPGPQR